MKRWPNFFIVGAPRSGTTSLYEYLNKTDQIFMSEIKEPNFFSLSVNPKLFASKPIRDKEEYLQLFSKVTNETAIGEATASYLWDPKSPYLIKEKIPDAKIIIILRDPIERSFSDYLYLVSIGLEKSTFHDAIRKSLKSKPDFSGRIIDAGMYYEQVKRYLDVFGEKQVKIVFFEEFSKDTENQVKNILKFLNISSDLPPNLSKIYNPQLSPQNKFIHNFIKTPLLRKISSKMISRSLAIQLKKKLYKEVPKPQFPEVERKFLQEIFIEDVKKLEKLLECKLSWQNCLTR